MKHKIMKNGMNNKTYGGIGDIEISSSLRRTQIEDLKSAHGMDLIQSLESELVRELTNNISIDIIEKVRLMSKMSRMVDDDDYETQNYEEWYDE